MHPILNFTDLTAHLQQLGRRFRLSIVCGSDDSTAGAAMRAVNMGFAEAIFVGDCDAVRVSPVWLNIRATMYRLSKPTPTRVLPNRRLCWCAKARPTCS